MTDQPIHEFFGLSYDNFIVLHRSIAQSMPVKWQTDMVLLLEEANDALNEIGFEGAASYTLHARNEQGRFTPDPVPHYRRGRTRLFN